jgi:hypothetical protein
MERDRRLTGYFRGQSDRAIAPDGFELNSPWKVCSGREIIAVTQAHLYIAGE